MKLQDIIGKCSNLNIYEQRCMNNDFCELVFYNRDKKEWDRILIDILGMARKPDGVTPTEDDLNLTKATGGIRINQTLFEKEFNNGTIIAKFWPWDDNTHITLRMAMLPVGFQRDLR